jgi:hypothetical protein
MNQNRCQTHCVPRISEGPAGTGAWAPRRWLKLTLKRYLGTSAKRKLKASSDYLARQLGKLTGRTTLESPSVAHAAMRLRAGDIVRVRTPDEIRSTLDSWHELRGCLFMQDMWQYCGTEQRVLKRVERFVDERDYRVKKAQGIVILEGLTCQGTPDYGRCDRACFYFWREEWLQRID